MPLAVGGPSTPDQRVLLALTTPLIGQFDPVFTWLMDDVMQLARGVLLTSNERCFAISGLPSSGIEALLNTLPDSGPCVVAHHLDPMTGNLVDLRALAEACHADGKLLLVDATYTLGGVELRTDEWGIDAVVAGVDFCLGAPSGMTLVTYAEPVEQLMQSRSTPPTSSYLDLLQLQAYWSPERLNHHTAPTSLVYGLREALRLVTSEGLGERWQRHAAVASQLRVGLERLGVSFEGSSLLTLADLREAVIQRLRDEFSIHVRQLPNGRARIGLLGADAQSANCRVLLAALAQVV